MDNIPEMNLEHLFDGMPAVTPAYGKSLAEAGAVCLGVGYWSHFSRLEFEECKGTA